METLPDMTRDVRKLCGLINRPGAQPPKVMTSLLNVNAWAEPHTICIIHNT